MRAATAQAGLGPSQHRFCICLGSLLLLPRSTYMHIYIYIVCDKAKQPLKQYKTDEPMNPPTMDTVHLLMKLEA